MKYLFSNFKLIYKDGNFLVLGYLINTKNIWYQIEKNYCFEYHQLTTHQLTDGRGLLESFNRLYKQS